MQAKHGPLVSRVSLVNAKLYLKTMARPSAQDAPPAATLPLAWQTAGNWKPAPGLCPSPCAASLRRRPRYAAARAGFLIAMPPLAVSGRPPRSPCPGPARRAVGTVLRVPVLAAVSRASPPPLAGRVRKGRRGVGGILCERMSRRRGARHGRSRRQPRRSELPLLWRRSAPPGTGLALPGAACGTGTVAAADVAGSRSNRLKATVLKPEYSSQ